jgi:nitrogen-specific signal transduction histidine kinase
MPSVEAKIGELPDPGLPPLFKISDPQKLEQLDLIVCRNALKAVRIQL